MPIQTRLSERNIVELVTKLQELGLLPADLLHSIQGREYITPDQLRQEVKHAVAHAGGRLALVRTSRQYANKHLHKMQGACLQISLWQIALADERL